ncbi:hypothetical protein R3P38DRAFT_3468803 [Favolaschia claudopus]|uniref:Uncharacterized protein n=1 Tax=Favolaschia claudopus TaxID=2862362 RepID=A0AAW0CN00_9AGAR
MTDQPALVAREARSIHAGLKTLLSGDVWANYREADFERKNLRRRYLHLLLLHPNARETRDAGTHLWMQTSYAFIALYKQRLNSTSRPQNHNNQRHNNNNNNPVETRKLLQRFRQFLADEDRFWRALVLRVQRAYEIGPFAPHVNLPPELVVGSGAAAEEEEHGHSATEDRMNHFGFPSAAAVSSAAETSVDGGTACSVLSKALVCLGDIARYREQYKMPPGKNPNAKKQQQVYIEPRPNYSRAKALYTAAHALAPEEGNAAHQLAILAGYESDPLASLFWYLRALCVAAPFDTAGENLAGMLAKAKAVDARVQGRQNGVAENEQETKKGGGGGGRQNAQNGNGMNAHEGEAGTDEEQEDREPPRVRVDRFRREVVLLHALWREGSTPALTRATPLASHLARAFARMVGRRMLPEEMIVRVLMVAQGAVWVGRMVVVPSIPAVEEEREGAKEKDAGKGGGGRNNRRNRTGTVTPATPVKSAEVEAREKKEKEKEERRVQRAHLIHVFELYDALLGVGVRELGEVDMYTTAGGGAVGVTGGGGGGGERGGAGARGGGRGRRGRGGGAGRGAAAGGGGVVSADAAVGGAVGAHGSGEEGVGLAERISAEFRRTLPALRVASRWVRANWAWAVPPLTTVPTSASVSGPGGRQSQSEAEEARGEGGRDGDGDDALEEARRRFWTTYAEFLRRLARTFPVGMLPKLSGAPLGGPGEGEQAHGRGQREEEEELELELDEDLDMLGWLPLLGSASENGNVGDGGEKNLKTAEPRKVTVGLREGVHPNVEQLMRIADLLRDARRLVGLPNSPLAMYGGVFVVKGVEAVVPAAPAPQSQSRLYQPQAVRQQLAAQDDEYDDDARTEKTSRTDDDLLHDAFAFLDQSDAGVSSVSEDGDDEDEDDDKIVWDLRDRVEASPRIPTTARTSPKTPVKPTPIGIGRPQPATATSISPLRPPPLGMGLGLSLGGIGIGIPSPHQQQQHAPMRSPQNQQQQQEPIAITTGSQVPATTALDLLNTFSKKPVPAAPAAVGMGMGGNDGLLFGSGAQQQSIWAAARDERGLMFGAQGGAGGGGGQQQHGLGQQAVGGGGLGGYAGAEQRQHGLGHHRFASQDPVGQQTIWASSYPTPQIPGSAPNMGGGFGHGHGLSPPTHQRGLSSSMVAAQQQLFPPRGGESYRYGPATPTSAPQYASGGGSASEMNVFYATSGQGFVPSPQQQQPIGSSLSVGHSPGHIQSAGLAPQGGFGQHTHARHLSLDPRAAASFHTHSGVQQPISPLSQLWGNVGG